MVFVYLDTCVWLSALISTDVKHNTAVSIFEEARKGNYTILVTHHVLSEILDVLKDKLSSDPRVKRMGTNPSVKILETLVKKKYQEFSARLLGLSNVRIKNPYVSAGQVFGPVFLNLLYRYFGQMKQSGKCPVCNGSYRFVECDTIYEKDALHAVLAWNLNCDRFVTFDNDFTQLKAEKSLSPMIIEVL